jgi:SurA N-terminal domain/PPIC-type PPIASE domain
MMKSTRKLFLGLLVGGLMSFAAHAQETETRVVDEVVAQVNDGVITLSQVKREIKSAVDSYVQDGKKREEAQKLVEEKQGELIASLINEELLMQRAKEGGFDGDVEAQINQRFADIMKQNGLKTVEELYAAMEKSGVDPKDIRENWRKQMLRDQVIQRDLQAKVYWETNGKQLKDYYEKHKDKFTKPETISFSELFLGFAGRDEAAVREKAKQISGQLKAGGDFDKIAKENGDPGILSQGTGKVENARLKELVEKVTNPLKGLKAGQFTEPFDLNDLGVVILRVDARSDASNESVYNENDVRMAIMTERMPEEQKKYMAKLRDESYIKISDTYRPIVSPVLFANERKEKSAN